MAKTQNIIKCTAELTKSPAETSWHFLPFSKEVVAKFAFEGKSKRVVCSINGDQPFQCALLPWGEIFYIIVNKQKRDASGIVAGDTVSVELSKDESKYGLPMPDELREVLNQDTEGDRLFHSLTAGKQRSVLYFIGKPRDIDLRIQYSLIVVEHLKEHGKVVDKVLYDELRRPIF